jgi:hypothetical protein
MSLRPTGLAAVLVLAFTLMASSALARPAGPGGRPVMGRTVVVKALAGKVFVRARGRARRLRPGDRRAIPVGSTVDASQGRVKLIVAENRGGQTRSGVFYGGAFVVTQDRTSGVTALALAGDLSGCAAHSPRQGQAAKQRPRERRLWGEAHGRFRTVGRYSAASVRGTRWLTEDLCQDTRTTGLGGEILVTASGPYPLTISIKADQVVDFYCSDRGPGVAPTYCVYVTSLLDTDAFGGFLLVSNPALSAYDLCITGPDGREACANHPLGPPDSIGTRTASFGCAVGLPGRYTMRWHVGGIILEPPLTTSPFAHGFAQPSCQFD